MPLSSYIVLWLLLTGTLARDEKSLLNKASYRFEFHGQSHKEIAQILGEGPVGIEVALRNLAEHTEVPLAIEMMPQTGKDLTIPIEINATNATVKGVLAQIVQQDPRYVYRERLGVIGSLINSQISSRTDPKELLDRLKRPQDFRSIDLVASIPLQVREAFGRQVSGHVFWMADPGALWQRSDVLRLGMAPRRLRKGFISKDLCILIYEKADYATSTNVSCFRDGDLRAKLLWSASVPDDVRDLVDLVKVIQSNKFKSSVL